MNAENTLARLLWLTERVGEAAALSCRSTTRAACRGMCRRGVGRRPIAGTEALNGSVIGAGMRCCDTDSSVSEQLHANPDTADIPGTLRPAVHEQEELSRSSLMAIWRQPFCGTKAWLSVLVSEHEPATRFLSC